MSEATEVVESSAAPEVEVSSGPLINLTSEERVEFRRTGELPQPKKEDTAPSSEAKTDTVKVETEGATEPPKPQENTEKGKHLTAKQRVEQLKATIARIEKEAGIVSETKAAESSTAKPESAPPPTRPKPTPEGTGPDGKPYAAYEDYIDDLTDWKGEQREAKNQREAAEQAQSKEFWSKVNEARSRYEKFDEVVQPTATAINSNASIMPVVKAMLNDSDYLPDIMFTLGTDPAELAKFVNMPTGKQLRYIALTESLIAEELEGKAKPAVEETPAKPKTAAPKPPAEAGGRAATPPDALESAAKANDFRSFKAESTRRQLAKLRG